jgi:hypothetical protein
MPKIVPHSWTSHPYSRAAEISKTGRLKNVLPKTNELVIPNICHPLNQVLNPIIHPYTSLQAVYPIDGNEILLLLWEKKDDSCSTDTGIISQKLLSSFCKVSIIYRTNKSSPG